MANYMTTDTELTNIANAIRNKSGTTATLNYPNDYITKINNLDTDPIAVISVTYPSGSTCTCTKGNVTLTAEDTGGKYNFLVSDFGSWTISCNDGSESASKTIIISQYAQVEEAQLKYLPTPGDILNNYSWEDISMISKKGVGDEYFDIGDCKAITLNGTIGTLSLNNYVTYVFILDFNHPVNESTADNNIIFGGFKTALTSGIDVCLCDSVYNTSQAGSTKYFNMNHWGSTSSSPYNTNYGGWAACDLRYDILGATETQPSVYGSRKTTSAIGYDATQVAIDSPMTNTLMAALPSDMRAALRLWARWVDNKGNNSNTDANVTAIVDAGISLLTEYEIFGSRTYANTYEQNHQKQIQYYTAGNSRVKYMHNATSSAVTWEGSSAIYNSAYAFCAVRTSGNVTNGGSHYSYGLAPAFKV